MEKSAEIGVWARNRQSWHIESDHALVTAPSYDALRGQHETRAPGSARAPGAGLAFRAPAEAGSRSRVAADPTITMHLALDRVSLGATTLSTTLSRAHSVSNTSKYNVQTVRPPIYSGTSAMPKAVFGALTNKCIELLSIQVFSSSRSPLSRLNAAVMRACALVPLIERLIE